MADMTSSTEPSSAPTTASRSSTLDVGLLVRVLVATLGAGFAGLIGWAVMRGDFMAEGAALLAMPWGQVTLADLYLGFVLYGLAVFAVEQRWLMRLVWAAPVFFLGNIWPVVWIIVRWGQIMRTLRPSA